MLRLIETIAHLLFIAVVLTIILKPGMVKDYLNPTMVGETVNFQDDVIMEEI